VITLATDNYSSTVYLGGNFTVTLPETPPAEVIFNLTDMNMFKKFSPQVSDQNAKMCLTGIYGLSSSSGDMTENTAVGNFYWANTYDEAKNIFKFAHPIWVDRNVTVKGTNHTKPNGGVQYLPDYTKNPLNLKKGWNWLYVTDTDTYEEYTITPFENMKWHFVK
jgi:hypothetical protein